MSEPEPQGQHDAPKSRPSPAGRSAQPYPGQPYPGQPYPGQPYPGQPYPGQPYPAQPEGYDLPAPPRPKISLPVTGWVLAGAAAVVFIGSVSPWATVHVLGDISVNGTKGDGALTLIFALIMAVMGVLIGVSRGRLWTSVVGTVFAALTLLTGVADAANIGRVYSGDQNSDLIDIGFGLWLVIVGGLVALVVAIAAMVRRSPRGGPAY